MDLNRPIVALFTLFLALIIASLSVSAEEDGTVVVETTVTFQEIAPDELNRFFNSAQPLKLPMLPADQFAYLSDQGSEQTIYEPMKRLGQGSFNLIAQPVPSPDKYRAPAHSVGKLFFKRNGKNYVCSAQLVGDFRTIVTAGHCVFNNGSHSTDIYFRPMYPIPGIGPFKVTKTFTNVFWRARKNYLHDYAVGTLDFPVLDGMASLGYVISPNFLDYAWTAFGYPAEGRFDGRTLYFVDGFGDILNRLPYVKMTSDMNGGSSGGGWLNNGRLVGLNSHTRAGTANTMYSPYLGKGFCILLKEAKVRSTC